MFSYNNIIHCVCSQYDESVAIVVQALELLKTSCFLFCRSCPETLPRNVFPIQRMFLLRGIVPGPPGSSGQQRSIAWSLRFVSMILPTNNMMQMIPSILSVLANQLLMLHFEPRLRTFTCVTSSRRKTPLNLFAVHKIPAVRECKIWPGPVGGSPKITCVI